MHNEQMVTVTSLGAFLSQRRSMLPPDADLDRPELTARRVPGLRREEVARRAGISTAYYTRLEQGRDHRASHEVVTALARALRLDASETRHLFELSAPGLPSPDEVVAPSTRALVVDQLSMFPVVVLGRRSDILAWNQKAHELLAGQLAFSAPEFADTRPNWARMLFLDESTRDLYVDWYTKAEDTVADLHASIARHRHDHTLEELVHDLQQASTEFAELWSRQPVRLCANHTRRYRHPTRGEIELDDHLLLTTDDSGQRLVIFTPTRTD